MRKLPLRIILLSIWTITPVLGDENVSPKPRLLIPPLQLQSTADATTTALTNALSQYDHWQVIAPQQLQESLDHLQERSVAVDTTAVAQANTWLQEGWQAFKNLDLAKAIDLLERAKIAYRNLQPAAELHKNLLTAYLHLGIAYLANGEKTRAEQEIKEMLRLDPSRASRKLSPKHYTPDVIATYQRLRQEMLDSAKARLTLSITPATAQISLDGMPVTGTSIDKLPAGEHFLIIQAPNYKLFFTNKFLIDGDNPVTVELQRTVPAQLESYFSPVESAYDLPQDAVNLLQQLRPNIEADLLVLYQTMPETKQLQAQLYDLRSQEISKKIEGDVATVALQLHKLIKADGSMTAAITTANAPENIIAFDPNASPVKTDSGITPWYKKWWVYSIIGAGALIVVGGVLLLDETPSTSTLIIDNPSN